MDFGTLLHAATKNDKVSKKEPIRCYSTKFEPPKKEQRSKELSANIKKFLAKKEAEEKRKFDQAQKKKGELLALRAQDKKATRRVNVMLKRTKSANQSAIEDAIDSNNTSVTLAGSAQPDEDDYGYVSQEASAFYSKMIEKYSSIPDEPKFSLDKKKKVSTNLSSTRDRVRAALEREKEEANMPHKRKRKHQETTTTGGGGEEEEVEKEEMSPPKAKRRPAAPPPMAFADLLKLAEKKQFEPIVIEQKPKEEEKLFTKKQKKEYEREKEWRDRKEGKLPPLDPTKLPPPKIKKGAQSSIESKVPSKVPTGNFPQKNNNNSSSKNNNKIASDNNSKKSYGTLPPKASSASSSLPVSNSSSQRRPEMVAKRKEDHHAMASSSKLRQALKDPRPESQVKSSTKQQLPGKQFPPRDIQQYKNGGDPKRAKQLDGRGPVPAPKGPPKRFPPEDVRGPPKRFPPPDVGMARHFPPKDVKRKQPAPPVNKRRILDDDDDEEYDSEMDDFIDDGPDGEEDISRHIRELFGYDKSKYRNMNEDDVDDMESSFAQMAREESISYKIGKWEDEQDMKLEAEQKKRKALMKKRMQKGM